MDLGAVELIAAAPGWYPDPGGNGQRYFDGITGTQYDNPGPLVKRDTVTLANWAITVGLFLLGVAILLLARSTRALRARRNPVVYHRNKKDSQQFWAVVAGVVGTGSLVVAVLAWLYPRN